MKISNQAGKVGVFVVCILILICLLVLGGIWISYRATQTSDIFSIGNGTQNEHPTVFLDRRSIDFGKIRLREKQTALVKLENVGKKTLLVFNVSTSCGCTSVTITTNGKTSPSFSMHNNPTSWIGEVNPGQTATLKIIYEPYKMPVQGRMQRTIFFMTNDPSNREVKIILTAKVT